MSESPATTSPPSLPPQTLRNRRIIMEVFAFVLTLSYAAAVLAAWDHHTNLLDSLLVGASFWVLVLGNAARHGHVGPRTVHVGRFVRAGILACWIVGAAAYATALILAWRHRGVLMGVFLILAALLTVQAWLRASWRPARTSPAAVGEEGTSAP
jgi:prepilin signal peptidase PulO-like enzyme (type II secretory pathway)